MHIDAVTAIASRAQDPRMQFTTPTGRAYCVFARYDNGCMGPGAATLLPAAPVQAGSMHDFSLTFEVGGGGLPVGGGIAVWIPGYYWSKPHPRSPDVKTHFSEFYDKLVADKKRYAAISGCTDMLDADDRGLVWAETDHRGSDLEMFLNYGGSNPILSRTQNEILLQVRHAPLPEGATITLHYQNAHVQIIQQSVPFLVFVDASGDWMYRPIAVQPAVAVHAGPCFHKEATAPSWIRPHDRMTLSIAALDCWGNCVKDCDDAMKIVLPDGGGERVHAFSPEDRGVLRVEMTLAHEGVYWIEVHDLATGRTFRANPVKCSHDPGDRKHWGDIHYQTGMSDAFVPMSAEDAVQYAKEVMKLDYLVQTDHVEDVWGTGYTPEKWARQMMIMNHARRPGAFETLLGFEWTSGTTKRFGGPCYGHQNVYFAGDAGRFIRSDTPEGETPEQMWEALKDYECFSIPHHPQVRFAPTDWNHIDPDKVPAVEIFSTWGSSEYYDCPLHFPSQIEGHGVQQGLSQGFHMGIVGGSDGHHGHPGKRALIWGKYKLPQDSGGLTCVMSEQLDRRSIWEAIKHRHTYATTGARILMDVRVNGKPMGDILQRVHRLTLDLEIHGTDLIDSVEIVRYQLGDPIPFPVAHTLKPGRRSVRFSWEDDHPLAGSLYYVRVTQADHEMAWSSPIWVR